jgi:hypothetical protein
VLGSAALLASLAATNEFYGWWISLAHYNRMGRGQYATQDYHLWRTLPLILGVIGLGSLGIPDRKIKGAVLTLSAAAALLAAYVDIALSQDNAWTLRSWIDMMAGAAMIAAGNHVMKQVPGRKLPAIVAAVGGVRVVASCLIPDTDFFSRSVIYEIGGALYSGDHGVPAIFAIALLGYALIGILMPFARSSPTARTTVISVLGYLLLFFFPLVIHNEWMNLTGGRNTSAEDDHTSFMLKFWLLGTGYTLLLGTGAATWMEGFLLERKPRQSST